MAESRRVPRFGRVLEPKVPDKNEFLALVAGYGDRENTVYAVNLSKANLPPILKVDGIERAAPFKEERFSRALADSIGNNFSLQAADLTVNQITNAMRNEAEHDHTAASRSRPISRAQYELTDSY
ncbi:hypothetical protein CAUPRSCDRAFT_12060 [Caulochytrium protostelioides]|uniref:Uncharacterized protein n=1 Tax=Caulochytrium protostelioides TaxID=1555241 RepID=A0A4V1IT92_9FUNG|nr:hypothetical protein CAUPRSCDRAFT_12060 [Caulochytrium protostelioides]